MKPGQVLSLWWQDYVLGRLRTPQDIFRAALSENPDPAQAGARMFDIPPDTDHWSAPDRLKAPSFFATPAYLKQMDRADWAHCDPRLMYWAAMMIKAARKRQIPLYVHCALRDKAEQDRVYAAGHSKVKYPRGAHNIGEAVDIVHGVYHWQMSRDEWALLSVLGRLCLDRVNAQLRKDDKLHLQWGGDFKSLYDPAHWEVRDYRARIRALPAAPPVRLTPSKILAQGLQTAPPS